jgi:type I restriction-modification system DNA methylase subunit
METTITYIRDVFRKEGITGMESINHCIFFTISRMLDEELCEKVKINKKFSYNNMIIYTNPQELFNKLYCEKNIDESLFGQIVNKLQFKTFKFKITNVNTVKNIMVKLKDLDIKNLSLQYDIIGTIYELYLKSGVNSMRELGQYYTNRQIINYMIKLCNPKLNDDGTIESILDPTMGTGGFLTMAIKHYNSIYDNIDWLHEKNNIIGFDIAENVKDMALLNAFLETGELFDKTLVKTNTLYDDLKFNDGKILQKAKIILANEPMGITNIVHANCCDRIKNLKIRGTKAEPLFLQLIMQALDVDGRCAVIVPDGMLSNNSTLHTLTRKYLIDNFNLKKVIEMNDKFFLNTNANTNILFFVNEKEKTKVVEFSELVFKNNDIIETSIIKVKYDDIVKNNYSLHVNKYNVSETQKIEGVDYHKFGDLCVFLQKSRKHASYGQNEGKYPFYTSSIKDTNIKRCDIADYNDECIIIGTGGCANIKYDNAFSCSGDNFVIKSKDTDKLLIKYVYYYLSNNIKLLQDGFNGTTIKHITGDYVREITIPIPDIETQHQIIKNIDSMMQEIENKNKQIQLISNSLNSTIDIILSESQYTIAKLSTMIDPIIKGINLDTFTINKNIKKKSTIPYYTEQGIKYCDKSNYDGEYILCITTGECKGQFYKTNGKFSANNNTIIIKLKNEYANNFDNIFDYLNDNFNHEQIIKDNPIKKKILGKMILINEIDITHIQNFTVKI